MPLLGAYDQRVCEENLRELAASSSKDFVIWVNGRDGLGDWTAPEDVEGRQREWNGLWDDIRRLSDVPRLRFVVLWGQGRGPVLPTEPAEERRLQAVFTEAHDHSAESGCGAESDPEGHPPEERRQ